jgi:UDP-2,3-diacylglucosamine pyrophosphatase LpxH
MIKRSLDIAVISDLHLGTYGCHAEEILNYLKSIHPKILILNGDIIDIWNLSKSYFPKSHMQVLRYILKMAEKDTEVYYITGNHDEVLRKYTGISIGNIHLMDKLILDLNGQKTWIFHGDIFDSTTKGWAKIIAKLGGKGYDFLILFNKVINNLLNFFGKEKISLSRRIKSSVKQAVKWIANFENIAAELAAQENYHTVICGHIHQPQMRAYVISDKKISYLNSGDWVEHCTALEYYLNKWHLYEHTSMEEIQDQDYELNEEQYASGSYILNLFNN